MKSVCTGDGKYVSDGGRDGMDVLVMGRDRQSVVVMGRDGKHGVKSEGGSMVMG